MENFSFTWSTAVSVLEPASPWGNCELPSRRVLAVEVSVLKNMNMQTKTKTMPITKAVMMIALPSHLDPANFFGGFMVHQALALRWLILCRLGYGIPRYYLVKHSFWTCVWRCFQEQLALESVDWEKQIAVPNVGGHHSVCWGPEKNKKMEEERMFSLCLTEWPWTSPALRLLLPLDWDLNHQPSSSWALRLRLEPHHRLSESPAWNGQIRDRSASVIMSANSFYNLLNLLRIFFNGLKQGWGMYSPRAI